MLEGWGVSPHPTTTTGSVFNSSLRFLLVAEAGPSPLLPLALPFCPGGPEEDAYFGLVKGKSVRVIYPVAPKNYLKLLMEDVTAEYLYVLTKEIVYTKEDRVFGKYAGKFLIIHKALYGLKTSANHRMLI